MAGGIDWFRWHHGSVNDPKFRLVAARACASVAEVVAVWACLLESASAAEVRGCAGVPDFEALDCALGLAEGQSQAIYTAMVARELVSAEGDVLSWEKRQPKRERSDDSSTERVRAFRERKSHETPGNANDAQATPAPASEPPETPRGEERREEPSSPPAKKVARETAAPAPRPDDVDPAVWSEWLALRRKKRATAGPTVVEGARTEAAKAGMSLEAFLRVWCRRGSQGLEAEWLKPHERGQSITPPNRQEAQEQRNRAVGDEWLRQQETADATR